MAVLLGQRAAAGSKCCENPVSRDVVVVGGGAAGAHAAVWLRDNDHTVAVVEKASQLVSFCTLPPEHPFTLTLTYLGRPHGILR